MRQVIHNNNYFDSCTDSHHSTLQALKLLRQHKVAQASLDKREGALDNLQNILHQIQMAETDAMVYIHTQVQSHPSYTYNTILCILQIYAAYKRGAEALKSLRESSGFTVDDIDEVAVSLQDALEANEEISHAINAPGI